MSTRVWLSLRHLTAGVTKHTDAPTTQSTDALLFSLNIFSPSRTVPKKEYSNPKCKPRLNNSSNWILVFGPVFALLKILLSFQVPSNQWTKRLLLHIVIAVHLHMVHIWTVFCQTSTVHACQYQNSTNGSAQNPPLFPSNHHYFPQPHHIN